jgi:hypothetical protein
MQYLQKVRSAGVFYLPFRIKPLRAIKQSFVCLPARTVQNFGGPNRNSLTSFGTEKRGTCPDDVRVFAFYSIGDRSRSSGLAGLLTGFGTNSPRRHLFSETTFLPFEFVLSLGSPPPDERLTDITFFRG